MIDRLKPPVRLNLEGRTLVQIVKEGLGWTTGDGLAGLDLDTMLIWSNGNQGEFWHQPPPVVDGHITTHYTPHRDLLYYDRGSLIRSCRTEGPSPSVVSSAVIKG